MSAIRFAAPSRTTPWPDFTSDATPIVPDTVLVPDACERVSVWSPPVWLNPVEPEPKVKVALLSAATVASASSTIGPVRVIPLAAAASLTIAAWPLAATPEPLIRSVCGKVRAPAASPVSHTCPCGRTTIVVVALPNSPPEANVLVPATSWPPATVIVACASDEVLSAVRASSPMPDFVNDPATGAVTTTADSTSAVAAEPLKVSRPPAPAAIVP